MDILDYLDAATRSLAAAPAKDVRDELYDHYLRAMECQLDTGHSFDEARSLALEALGPIELMPSLAPAVGSIRGTAAILCLAAAWLFALLSVVYPVLFSMTAGLSIAAFLLQPPKRLGQSLRAHPIVIALGMIDGLVVGAYPLWSAGPYSYWPAVATSVETQVVVGLLMLSTPLYLFGRMARSPGREFMIAGLGLTVFVLSGVLSTILLGRGYPMSPSSNVDWYTTSWVGLTHEGTHAIWFAVLWYLGSFAVAAIIREVRRRRVESATPLVAE